MAHAVAEVVPALTLADSLGMSVEPKMTFEMACDISRGLKGGTVILKIPIACEKPLGLTKIVDLPMRMMDDATLKVKHLIDIIPDIPVYDWMEIKGLLLQHKFDRLPEPFRPKATIPVPFTMQVIAVSSQDEGGSDKVFLLKHFIFDSMQKVGIVKPVLQGQAHTVNFGGNQRGGPKGFQYMLDKLGGQQVRCYSFEDGVADKLKTESEIDDAYDFILGCAPRQEGSTLEQSRWIKKQINSPESPIFLAGFSPGDVWQSMKKIRDMELQAEIVKNYPFFLSDIEDWYVDSIIQPMVSKLRRKGVLMLGAAGIGKTPVLQILMSAMSRWHKHHAGIDGWTEAHFRTASALDFFRLEKGIVDRPDCLDDSDLNEYPMSKLKAFFDMTLLQAQTKERWGAAVWPQGQLRVAADNKFDPTAEMSDQETADYQEKYPNSGAMSYGRFSELVRPAFCKECSIADLDVMLKRCNVFVHCKKKVYCRLAGIEGASQVLCIPMCSEILLKDETVALLGKWTDTKSNKKGGNAVRSEDEMHELAEKEFKWVDKLMEGDTAFVADDKGEVETEYEVATKLVRSFSNDMLGLPYGFGGVPPQLEGNPNMGALESAAVVAEYKRDSLLLFDGKVRAMKQQLERNIEEASQAFLAKKNEVPEPLLEVADEEDPFNHFGAGMDDNPEPAQKKPKLLEE
jgi:hypothetical protein